MDVLVHQGPGKKALEQSPKPQTVAPADAVVRVAKTTVCGTDRHILEGDVQTGVSGRIRPRRYQGGNVK